MAGWNFTIMVHQRTKDEINGCVGLCRLRLRVSSYEIYATS